MGHERVQSITHDEVQVWISEMATTKSASLVRRTAFTLRALLKKAKDDKCIHENPCDDLALPRMVRKKHIYLTIGQLLALADASGWHRPIILTLGLCGLRWGELVGLQVGDVDFTRQRIHIVRTAAEIRSRIVVDIPKPARPAPSYSRHCSDHAWKRLAGAVSRPNCCSLMLVPAHSFGGHMELAGQLVLSCEAFRAQRAVRGVDDDS